MTDLALLLEAGDAAWRRGDGFVAHEWWEAAWLRTPEGPLREGLRAMTQWAAAAHVESLGRYAAAEAIRSRAQARWDRTATRLALAPYVLDLPSAQQTELVLRDQRTPLPVTAILLAAGHGRRAGGPKALVPVDGQPLWRRQVQRLHAIGIQQVVAVLHPSVPLAAEPPLILLHGDADATPLDSLQRGLALSHGPMLVLPVDCPAPSRAVVVQLLATALRTPDARAVRPVVQTEAGPRGGHPLWMSAVTCQQIARLDPAQHRLDTFLHTLGSAYRDVPVADARVLGNFNVDGVSA